MPDTQVQVYLALICIFPLYMLFPHVRELYYILRLARLGTDTTTAHVDFTEVVTHTGRIIWQVVFQYEDQHRELHKGAYTLTVDQYVLLQAQAPAPLVMTIRYDPTHPAICRPSGEYFDNSMRFRAIVGSLFFLFFLLPALSVLIQAIFSH